MSSARIMVYWTKEAIKENDDASTRVYRAGPDNGLFSVDTAAPVRTLSAPGRLAHSPCVSESRSPRGAPGALL